MNLAAANEISADAAVAVVLSELDSIFDHHWMCFSIERMFYSPNGFVNSSGWWCVSLATIGGLDLLLPASTGSKKCDESTWASIFFFFFFNERASPFKMWTFCQMYRWIKPTDLGNVPCGVQAYALPFIACAYQQNPVTVLFYIFRSFILTHFYDGNISHALFLCRLMVTGISPTYDDHFIT